MSCDWARKSMVLADGLTKEEQVELEAHLSQCPSCAEEWRRWQKLFALLNQLPSISSTPEERTQLMHALNYVPQVPELSCSMAKDYIWRWLDSDLSEREKASLIVHLANCDKCQGVLWQAEQMSYMLRSLPRLKATAAEKEALKARLKRMSKRPTLIPFVWRVALPVAAAAVLTLAVLVKLQSPTHDRTTLVQSGREEAVAPSIATTRPIKPELPKVAKQTEQPKPKVHQPEVRQPEVRRPQVLAQSQQPTAEPKQIQTAAKQPVEKLQIVKSTEHRRAEKLAIPEPPETFAPIQTAPEPTVKPEVQETFVAEAPKVAVPPAVTAPIPSSAYEVTSVPALSAQTPPSQPVQESPTIASPSSEPRQLIALSPVTIESDFDLRPPRVKFTVVPPSQRLYQKSGVALVTVPPEKRPLKVSEEQALAPDLSIPLAAERYRSHTATIPFFRFGVSW